MTIAVGDGTSGYSGYIDVRDESDSVDSSNLMQFIGVGSNIFRKAMRKKIQQIFSLSLFVYVVVISRFFTISLPRSPFLCSHEYSVISFVVCTLSLSSSHGQKSIVSCA